MALQQAIQFVELRDYMAKSHSTFRSLADRTVPRLDKMTIQRLCAGTFKTFNPDWIAALDTATHGAIGNKEFLAFLERRRSAVKANKGHAARRLSIARTA